MTFFRSTVLTKIFNMTIASRSLTIWSLCRLFPQGCIFLLVIVMNREKDTVSTLFTVHKLQHVGAILLQSGSFLDGRKKKQRKKNNGYHTTAGKGRITLAVLEIETRGADGCDYGTTGSCRFLSPRTPLLPCANEAPVGGSRLGEEQRDWMNTINTSVTTSPYPPFSSEEAMCPTPSHTHPLHSTQA